MIVSALIQFLFTSGPLELPMSASAYFGFSSVILLIVSDLVGNSNVRFGSSGILVSDRISLDLLLNGSDPFEISVECLESPLNVGYCFGSFRSLIYTSHLFGILV